MFQPLSRAASWLMLATVLAALAGCGSLDRASNGLAGMITPYKVDIVQGNFVSREQREALKEGMSRVEVRDILGTPLLASVFHADRWDYVFTMRRQGVEPQSRRLTVFFKNDRLQRVEADPLPSEDEFVALIDPRKTVVQVPVLQMTDEQLKATAMPAKAPQVSKDLPPLPMAYPPLEASSK